MRVGNLINALDNVSVLNPEVVSERSEGLERKREESINSKSGKVTVPQDL